MDRKKILFLLPNFALTPVGGYKIVFEYANRFAREGCEVSIAYASFTFSPCKDKNFKTKAIHYMLRLIRGNQRYTARRWFDLDPKIQEEFPVTLHYRNIPKADIYIATANITAEYVAKYPRGEKYYFIQDYENWDMTDEELEHTYKLPLEKIVISNWLSEMLRSKGFSCSIVPNGFDRNQYYLTIPIEKKERRHISVMYHFSPHKDFTTALKALEIVHKEKEDIHVDAFGNTLPTEPLPKWIHFHLSPPHEEHLRINNASSIYVAASCSEGWGLTIGEAMMCGQAVVCTDANGFLEMAVNERNALVSPVRDANALAANIIRLLDNDKERCRIAQQGLEDIKQFDIEESYNKFKRVLFP